MRGVKLQAAVTLVTETCCNCGIPFAMPEELKAERLADKLPFYCPRGHRMSYTGESDQDRIRRLEEERDRLLTLARQRLAEAEHERRRSAAARGVATRLKRKLAAGGCPFCERSFDDLAHHMAEEHADRLESEEDPSDG